MSKITSTGNDWLQTAPGIRPGTWGLLTPDYQGGGGSWQFIDQPVDSLLFLHGNGQPEAGLSFLSLAGGGLLDLVG